MLDNWPTAPHPPLTRPPDKEFELTINLDRVAKDAEHDINGTLTYDEFKVALA